MAQVYDQNHYIMFLQNKYNKQINVLDVSNHSTDELFYKFDDIDLDNYPSGEYTFAIIWCILDYSVELSNVLLDCVITVTDKDGEEHTYKLRELMPEMGTLIIPDDDTDVIEATAIDEKQDFYSL